VAQLVALPLSDRWSRLAGRPTAVITEKVRMKRWFGRPSARQIVSHAVGELRPADDGTAGDVASADCARRNEIR